MDKEYAACQKLVRGVYTFGQPMVGDAAFADACAKSFGKLLYRHVYANDFIPRLPPLSFEKFRHFGSERRSAKATEPWTLIDGSTLPLRFLGPALIAVGGSFLARRIHLLRELPFAYSMDDHSPIGYIESSRVSRDAAKVPGARRRR